MTQINAVMAEDVSVVSNAVSPPAVLLQPPISAHVSVPLARWCSAGVSAAAVLLLHAVGQALCRQVHRRGVPLQVSPPRLLLPGSSAHTDIVCVCLFRFQAHQRRGLPANGCGRAHHQEHRRRSRLAIPEYAICPSVVFPRAGLLSSWLLSVLVCSRGEQGQEQARAQDLHQVSSCMPARLIEAGPNRSLLLRVSTQADYCRDDQG